MNLASLTGRCILYDALDRWSWWPSRLRCVWLACDCLSRQAGTPGKNVPPGTLHIHGAGATFPAPLYKKWLEEYHKRRPEVC